MYLVDEGGREDGTWKSREIPMRIEKGIFFPLLESCNGLACVPSTLGESDPLFVYNPITMDFVKLPRSADDIRVTYSVGFGFDAKGRKYKVVRLFDVENDPELITSCEIITLDESSWRRLEIPYQMFIGIRPAPVFLDGTFHWVIDKRFHPDGPEQILALDLSTEKFRTIDFPLSTRYSNFILLFKCGEFMAITEHGIKNQIRVVKVMGNSADGYRVRKNTHILLIKMDLPFKFALSGFLSDGSFLFELVYDFLEGNTQNDQLALYCPKKKSYHVVDVSPAPPSFRGHFFVPSLVSPSATMSQGAQKET
ncbi:hypothetical protein GIB67_022993 [Kingdonia uniflora]|uniref:F-box associated beta-propeller type 1 domain-containing protein n=1 Tax=Kingdonia uniflora TaxID=39325 RepID=A0A7J7P389_9MAGN|nr:hypothetical protein GIB67_022993 [Kingdonia uniflora]